jgi:hypothetical protein
MKITELKSNEGGLHYYNKGYLMDWIVNKEVVFQDQKGYRFYINVDYMEFGSMESYVYKESGVMEPYDSGQCCDCIKALTPEEYDELFDMRFSNEIDERNEWNKNIVAKDNNHIYYKTHPCNFCKYKGVVDCILVFDIAFARKGEIKIAIEVNNTSPVKWNKLDFCQKNDITLIQVEAKEINFATQRINKIVSCEVLNIGESMFNGMKFI